MAFPIVLAWIPSTFAGDTKSGVGLGIVIAVTHAVSLAASYIYPTSEAPKYLTGNAVSCALCGATAVLSLAMAVLLARDNKKRDRQYGPVEPGAVVHLSGDPDKEPTFRYML